MQSEIVPEDSNILRNFVDRCHPLSNAYEDCWGYIIQATRYNGFKIINSRSNILVFFGSSNPEGDILTIPLFFGNIEDIAKIVDIIYRVQKCRIILKNVDLQDINNFCLNGFRTYHEGEVWSVESPYDDQTFPQTVIDLNDLIPCQGRKYHKLKNVLNRADRIHKYELRPFSLTNKQDIVRIIEEKDIKSKFCDKHVFFDAHRIYLDDAQGMHRFVITDFGITKGFIATSSISNKSVALCAAIFDQWDEVGSIWGIYNVLYQELKNGFAIANLGGSESASVFEFKRQTFKPSTFIKRTHLVWDR